MSMNNTLVKLTDITFSYNGSAAIQNINLDIHEGDFLGIIGPNGSGKTTLLHVILGLLAPSSGEVELFGRPIKTFKDWQKIGFVPQKPGKDVLSFPISVKEVVGMGGASASQVHTALKEVDMTEHATRLIRDLSGGEQQRVFIARALVGSPKLLILDEPTVGVDQDSQVKFYDLLRRLNQKNNMTLVLVSHDIDVVAHEVTVVACINRTLIFHGSPKEVIKNDHFEKIYGKELKLVIHGH